MKLDIGSSLKEEREKQNLTLEEVAKKTLIREYYLEQIENNEFKQYDGFINAYIRKYAEALGMDPEPLVTTYKALFREKEENKKSEDNSHTKRFYTIFVALLLVCFFAVFALIHTSKRSNPQNTNNSSEITVPSTEETQKPSENVTQPKPEEGKKTTPSVENKMEGINVTVSADELCWVGVTIDGQYSQFFIRKGESKTFKGKQYVKIKFGNATHAFVSVNEKSPVIVSKNKKVLEVTYKP